jgi:hypothetical protein
MPGRLQQAGDIGKGGLIGVIIDFGWGRRPFLYHALV